MAFGLLRAEALLPQGWWRLSGAGRKALEQRRIGHQPIQATGQLAGQDQQQRGWHHQQNRGGDGRNPQRQILQTHAGTAL